MAGHQGVPAAADRAGRAVRWGLPANFGDGAGPLNAATFWGHSVAVAIVAFLLLSGDVPFIRTGTMRLMLDALGAEAAPAAVVLGFRPPDAGAYGRIVAEAGGRIVKMVEHKDATEEERACRLCNTGVLAAPASALFALLREVGNDNAQGEYYLPDFVNIAAGRGETCAVVVIRP